MGLLKQENGYILVEVLVAAVILLMAVLAISGLLLQSYRIMDDAEKRSVSLHLAQEEMEAAIMNPSYYSNHEESEISRVPHQIEVFGQMVSGTLVTVKRTYPGQPGGELVYTYFVPGEVAN
ncbi:MAG: hypothetical protein WAQ10_00240 [Dethiobacteria bacterium]|jgi:type II secretory pathway pseudopilin PulG|nr:hypothetical protein [Bacillota bacterium]HOJ84241.1 hypothetical protein [Bacillota bacterium]HOL16327.1 hypothetical protein [Bacillota bacterium]HPU00472.1 hypothetical protein [Bacillota bacterium]HQE10290.1 hypothetical protein [Bacillota bacterium]